MTPSYEILRQFLLGDTLMRLEPASRRRRVALAGVDVDFVGGVFAVAMDDEFAGKFVVIVGWFVGSNPLV